jgi:membrane protein YdbS with pleckstrin-like domain
MTFLAETQIAKLRPRAVRLFWPGAALFLAAFALSFFGGRLTEQWHNILLWSVTGAIAFIFWFIPLLRYLSTYVEITSNRVISRSGLMGQNRREVSMLSIRQVEPTRGRSITLYVEGEDALVLQGLPKHKLVAAEIERLSASK